jgi:hypothetical protein
MAVILTIGGTSVTFIEDTLDITYSLDERQRLQCDVIDYTGSLHFVKGEQVVLTDPVLGVMFNGYLNSDQEFDIYPTGGIKHTIDCIDQHYLADKRTYTRIYPTSQLAGKLAVDQLQDVLVPEGITQNFAQHSDSTVADFNTGILTNAVSISNIDDGNLEIAKMGTSVVLSENTQFDFSTGTLINTTATANGLVPTSSSAIQLIGAITNASGGRVAYKIWSGSKTIGANDFFNYDIWISSTSPSGEAGINFTCSDGTTLGSISGTDVQGFTGATSNDLSGIATDTWYKRSISLSGISGKTISFVTINISSSKQGTYAIYCKNIYLSSASGSPFFSTTATATQQNPPTQMLLGNFTLTSIGVITAYGVATTGVPPTYVRYSSANSISAASLLRSSLLTWKAILLHDASVSFRASYDGGVTFLPATFNTEIPGLLAGASTVGKSILLEETLSMGTTPATAPTLTSTTIDVESAPITTTRNDFTKTFSTSTDWNTGTLTNLVVQSATWALSSSWITLNGFTRTWQDGTTTGQTAWVVSGGLVGMYNQAMELQNYTVFPDTDAKLQLGFAGNWQNFTAAVDIIESNGIEAGFVYRTTHWDTQNNTYAYTATMSSGSLIFAKSSNSSSPSSTTIATATNPVSGGNAHRLKIIINGNNHQTYLDGIQYINSNDSTFTSTGNIGLRHFGDSSDATISRFANFGVVPVTSGTWVSPSSSLTSVGTYGSSSITWRADVASSDAVILVETSINGGSTYQAITNNGNPIPNLTVGQSLSGITLKVRITLTTLEVITLPAVSGLTIVVSNYYDSVTATRSTIPLGNDTMVRSNVVGSFGTAFDSQTYTKVGTGTTNLTSNEGQITNTTGDVHMLLGSRIWTDEDGTVRFSLSAATITGGIELRYQDVNNFYRLAATTTTLSIIKKSTGTTTTLASTSITLSTGTFYWLRFRAVGNGPVNLYGRVWADGTKEDQTAWTITASV